MGHACTWIKTNNATCAILRPGGVLTALHETPPGPPSAQPRCGTRDLGPGTRTAAPDAGSLAKPAKAAKRRTMEEHPQAPAGGLEPEAESPTG